MWVHNWFFLNTYTYTHTYSVTSKPNNVVLEKACVICCKLLSTQEFRLQQGTHFIQIRSYFSFLCMCLLWSDQKLTDCFSSCISNPNGRKSVYPHTQKKKSLISLNQKVIFPTECTTTHWWGNVPWPWAFTRCCQPRVSYPTWSKKHRIPHLVECETRHISTDVKGMWEESLCKKVKDFC